MDQKFLKMFVVALVGQKGGTGKTTVATGVAVAAAKAGNAVVIIDLDPQANAANWKDRRSTDNPAVVSVPPSRLKATLEAAKSHGATFVIVDSPGHADTAAIEAARVADLVLIPCWPQMFHLETLPGLRDLLRVAGDKPAFVTLNMIHPQATTQAAAIKTMVADIYPFPVCPVHLSRLDIYQESNDSGITPIEQDSKGQAAAELQRLYNFIYQQSNKLDSPHGKSKELTTGR